MQMGAHHEASKWNLVPGDPLSTSVATLDSIGTDWHRHNVALGFYDEAGE